MWNQPTTAQLAIIPRFYQSEEIPFRDKLVYLHFSIGTSDWWVFEFNGKNTFFGFVILNNNLEMSEIGYFSLGELSSVKINGWHEIECDLYWKIRPANQVDKICVAKPIEIKLTLMPCLGNSIKLHFNIGGVHEPED